MRKFSFLLLLVLFGCEDSEIAKIRKEAENGNPIAQFNLAEQYYNGGKLKQDQNEGIKWYEKSAKQGNIEAIKKLSTIYINKKQYEKAIAYINEICNYSKKENLCKNKESIEKDYHIYKIKNYLDENNLDGFINSAILYTNKYINHSDSYDEHAKELYQIIIKAREQINAFSESEVIANLLGWMYEVGYGTDKNYNLAKQLYLDASNKNFESATYNLARLYQNGNGVIKDYAKAKSLYEKVLGKKKKMALYHMGVMEICNSTLLYFSEERRIKMYETSTARNYIIDSCNLGFERACDLENRKQFSDYWFDEQCDKRLN